MSAILTEIAPLNQRPVLDSHLESNVPGLYVIGGLAGAPVVKRAMEHGYNVANRIASKIRPAARDGIYDVVVAGAGAAGLNAALVAQERGLRVLVLEKNKVANTIEEFPEGKWVYAEPDAVAPKGKLWLDGATKEDLLARWHAVIAGVGLEVYAGEGVASIERSKDGLFRIQTNHATYASQSVVLATGQRGAARKLGVPGEERPRVYHRLYSPKLYGNEDILVVGGGNSAVEAALTLSEHNRVTLSYRGTAFARVFKDNKRKLKEAAATGNLRVIFDSQVVRFDEHSYALVVGKNAQELPYQHAFVLIGAEPPAEFLRSLGLRLENDWTGNPFAAIALVAAVLTALSLYAGANSPWLFGALVGAGALAFLGARGNRFAWLGLSFLIAYTIYAAKQGGGHEYWPYRGWGLRKFSFFDRPWSFWYTVLYTLLLTVFGIPAMKRWGFDKRDKFQIWRYVSLIGFQWTFFFLIPEFLFRWTANNQWIAGALANNPANAWRSYGLVYAWPLFFYTFFDAPSQIWIVWGALLSFVVIPVLVLFHGKRYCSWICGCGGLAETLGDRWRHLAPKGKASIDWERMNVVVLSAAVVVTLLVLLRDAFAVFAKPSALGLDYYHLIADTWLVGILPVTLYPFFGGKVWCRYWCPLAKMMQIFSALFARFRVSRFAIHANEKCIACGECSRNCQVGINVMNFAMKQEVLNNFNTSCIGCGICVTVCPMGVLSFSEPPALVQISPNR